MALPLVALWRVALRDDPDLPGPALAVALTLSVWMNPDGTDAFPSIPSLAAGSGFSPATVRRHVRRLEADGWLTVAPSKGGRGRDSTNRWRATFPPGHPHRSGTRSL